MDLDIRRCVESLQYEGRHRQAPVDVYPRGGAVWFDDQRWWTIPPRKTDRVERGFDRRGNPLDDPQSYTHSEGQR